MINFAYPYFLYLLFLIPLLVALYFLTRLSRKKKLEKFGRPGVLTGLMPDASSYMGWTKITLECLAVGFIVIAIARPYTNTGEIQANEEEKARGIEVMVCLDVSNSMLASSTDDPRGVSRLKRAKFILEKLIDKMDEDKVGLIVFAGDAYTQLPITSDFLSAKMFLNDITTDMVPTQGTAIGAAIEMAVNSFTPESDFQKAIVLITDGENFEDEPVEEARRAAEAGIQVDVVGLGSGKGSPIPLNQNHTEYMTDYNGMQIITALDESMAKAIAKAGNGEYFSGSSSSVVSDIDAKLNELGKTEYIKKKITNPAGELFPLAAIIALIFLLIDSLLPYSKIVWLKNINFFTNSTKNENKQI